MGGRRCDLANGVDPGPRTVLSAELTWVSRAGPGRCGAWQTALSALYYRGAGLRRAFPLFTTTRLRAFAPAHIESAPSPGPLSWPPRQPPLLAPPRRRGVSPPLHLGIGRSWMGG